MAELNRAPLLTAANCIAGWVDSDSVINFPTRTYGEHASVVGKWLDRYTGKRNEHRSDCIYWAFKEAYGTK